MKQKILDLFEEKNRERFELLTNMLVRLIEDQKELQDIVDREGYTYKAGELTKPNPAVAQLRETQKQILTMSARFGLSPRDLQLLERDLEKEKEEEDFSEFGDLDE
ncbi:P27 family phage terminase small subunit [Acetobacter tropicalis]|uniref:P27 family phage terminase small subunit n=1 Tax=Acetobacter tropicalis TaxID=104102 RepID=UPI000587DBD7|nr:P27 family phage terminase small subunit [Acetobacter tropicalis]